MSHSLSHSIVWQQKQKLLQWEQPYWEFSCNKIQYVSTAQKIQFTLMQFKTVRFSFIYIAQIHNSSHLGAFYILSKLQCYEEKTIIFFEVKGWQERHLGLGCTVAQKATWKHSNPHQSLITGSRFVLKFSHFLTDYDYNVLGLACNHTSKKHTGMSVMVCVLTHCFCV